MDINALVHLFLYLLGACAILGLLLYLVTLLPASAEPFKTWLRIGVIVLAVIILIFWILSLMGAGPPLRVGRY